MKIAEGTKLGRYEVRGLIGVGGMGEVYRASYANSLAYCLDKLPLALASGKVVFEARL